MFGTDEKINEPFLKKKADMEPEKYIPNRL